MNFDAISKNAKILKIGPLEPKLWKFRETTVVKTQSASIVQYRHFVISGLETL